MLELFYMDLNGALVLVSKVLLKLIFW